MPIPLPSAKAQLEAIRERWLAARAACIAHARAQVEKARSQRRHGNVTFGLSLVVVPLVAGLPFIPPNEYAWVSFLGATVAGGSALSKFLEQRLVRPEEIGAHATAERELQDRLEQLNLAGAHVHESVLGSRQLDLETVKDDVRRVNEEIGGINDRTQIVITDADKKAADDLFARTSIQDALEGVKRRLAGDDEPARTAAMADLPEDAAGIVPVRRRRSG